jgi:hypothetical protein
MKKSTRFWRGKTISMVRTFSRVLTREVHSWPSIICIILILCHCIPMPEAKGSRVSRPSRMRLPLDTRDETRRNLILVVYVVPNNEDRLSHFSCRAFSCKLFVFEGRMGEKEESNSSDGNCLKSIVLFEVWTRWEMSIRSHRSYSSWSESASP